MAPNLFAALEKILRALEPLSFISLSATIPPPNFSSFILKLSISNISLLNTNVLKGMSTFAVFIKPSLLMIPPCSGLIDQFFMLSFQSSNATSMGVVLVAGYTLFSSSTTSLSFTEKFSG